MSNTPITTAINPRMSVCIAGSFLLPTPKCQAEIWTTGRIGERAKATLASLELCKRVVPTLREETDILSLVPPPLLQCKRLIETNRPN